MLKNHSNFALKSHKKNRLINLNPTPIAARIPILGHRSTSKFIFAILDLLGST